MEVGGDYEKARNFIFENVHVDGTRVLAENDVAKFVQVSALNASFFVQSNNLVERVNIKCIRANNQDIQPMKMDDKPMPEALFVQRFKDLNLPRLESVGIQFLRRFSSKAVFDLLYEREKEDKSRKVFINLLIE
ncbi:unnamed protein product [Rhizopus stolonifer]